MQKMESRYKVLVDLKEKGIYTKLVSSGMISINVCSYMSIYEEYLKHRDYKKKPIAIRLTAKAMKISESNLYAIIRYMQ